MTRVIAVAVNGAESDLAALSWTSGAARAGDVVHVVHPYSLLSFAECSWRPAVSANDARREYARHVVAMSTQVVRERNHAVVVDGSAVVGRALPVLADMSTIVDLLVVAADARDQGTCLAPAVARRTACPVVIVPASRPAADARPVGLLVEMHDLPATAVEFAFEEAARRGAELVVSEPVGTRPSGLPVCDDDISAWERVADETLSADLAAWQEKYRAAGVLVEVRRESPSATARLLERTCQLVVVPRGNARANGPLGRLARAALQRAACPVVVVPDARAPRSVTPSPA